jgi:hypothetical protein
MDCRAEDNGRYLIQGSVLSAYRQKMNLTISYTVHVNSTEAESSKSCIEGKLCTIFRIRWDAWIMQNQASNIGGRLG